MHFRTKGCRCTTYQDTHISELAPILKNTTQVVINREQLINLELAITTPSVAIWDEDGEMAYFGPYSSGVVCGEGTGFVERTLTALQQGINPSWLYTQGVGCFCKPRMQESATDEVKT
ncbi:DUF6436 domain-containing protein [Bermanella sp. R86510]|uniref:DUF6436 domain-containing protein n=1 Tax=unclassified Bermanella TaxID=2627862 RepID=UPI0037CBF1B1